MSLLLLRLLGLNLGPDKVHNLGSEFERLLSVSLREGLEGYRGRRQDIRVPGRQIVTVQDTTIIRQGQEIRVFLTTFLNQLMNRVNQHITPTPEVKKSFQAHLSGLFGLEAGHGPKAIF